MILAYSRRLLSPQHYLKDYSSIDDPVANGVVHFSAPSSGPSATLPLSTTIDADGHIHVIATANAITGSYVITATTAGATAPAIFTLTNLGPH